MKSLGRRRGRYQFQTSQEELDLLSSILRLYPHSPHTGHAWNPSARNHSDSVDQALLLEALEAQRLENKAAIDTLLNGKNRFRNTDHGIEFSLALPELEQLMQALNDVRVGSWYRLGCPTDHEDCEKKLNGSNVHLLVAMEAAASFELALINAFGSASSSIAESG